MQLRYIKDFAIALIVILLLAYAIRLYSMNTKRNTISDKSKYTFEAVSDTLRAKVRAIESSINDRQNYVFAINHDPLRQGNIIKDRFDFAKEFDDMVRNTFRLTGTYDLDKGQAAYATFEYQDRMFIGRVGENIEGRLIRWISDGRVGIYYGGDQTLVAQPRPAKPDINTLEIQNLNQNY